MNQTDKKKVEYGDFQTPLELSLKVCQKLVKLGVNPDVIIEPTCGVGNFIEAAAYSFPSAKKIIGVDINYSYLKQLQINNLTIDDKRIEIKHGNFFQFDWLSLLGNSDEKILVLGNFPWVTNSQQGIIDGRNLPHKNNFQNYNGFDAITGKSNFDISEWMLIKAVQWLQNSEAYLAMLCKTSVSRKLLNYIHSQELNLYYCANYRIDAKKYFEASVEACLCFCHFDSKSKKYFCDVFNDLESSNYNRIGYHNNILIRDIEAFDKLKNLYGTKTGEKWRSGVKHDSSNVMEFRKIGDELVNGLGESVELEDTYLFPLIKGSDVAQARTDTTNRYVLITQEFVGQSTEPIKNIAPKTWDYLESHAKYLDRRKSKIYLNNPRFSIFGVGAYTFKPWKIAICGLYKKLDFRLIGIIDHKPAIFDDTVYFISFDDEQVAHKTFEILTSPSAISFYSSLIFWDEKRPIKSSILNSLKLKELENSEL
jgi:hypothetical protein